MFKKGTVLDQKLSVIDWWTVKLLFGIFIEFPVEKGKRIGANLTQLDTVQH